MSSLILPPITLRRLLEQGVALWCVPMKPQPEEVSTCPDVGRIMLFFGTWYTMDRVVVRFAPHHPGDSVEILHLPITNEKNTVDSYPATVVSIKAKQVQNLSHANVANIGCLFGLSSDGNMLEWFREWWTETYPYPFGTAWSWCCGLINDEHNF